VDDWINEVLSILQRMLEKGEEVPDYVYQEIVRALEESETQPIRGALPEAPKEMPSAPYPSSNINGFKYDPESGKLFVQFHGPYPQASGSIYSYDDVPAYIFDIFARGAVGPKTSGQNQYHKWVKGVTPSHGAALNALLKKGNFAYQKLS